MGGRGAPLCAAQPVVAEGGPAREPLQLLEVSPRKRLTAGPEQDPCGSRPAPEGAGAGAEQGHSAGGGGWCRHCHTKLAELKRQAWKLVSGPGTPLRDPCLSALLLDKLPACRPEAERRCDVCATRLNQLSPEALRLLQAPASREDPDAPRGGPGLTPPSTGTGAATSQRDVPAPAGRQPSRAGPDRRKGLAWPSGPSVQVSVAPAGLGGALSTVTIQAQQCLEGMWSVSRVNSFLPPSCLAEAAVAAVAVADTVRDGPPSVGPDGMLKTWAPGGACSAALVTPAPGTPVGGSTGPSAAASFFLRAAQKLSLASKRKKPHPPPAPTARGASTYPTDFSGVLQLWPPPAPPCLLRAASKAKDNPSSVGKVKVMLRIWPEQGAQRSAESTSFLKVDPRKKQVTLYDPAAGPPGSAGSRRATPAAVPKMFAFDAVFPQDSEQAEVCSGTVADVLQSVVSGADGCIFSFGHTSLGKSFTMIGRDSSPQSLGVVPCAISWLFRLLDERKERTGTRFSVRVSAVEVCGRDQSLRDLLAEVASSSLQDAQSPGVYLREDPVCGAQLQNQSELRAPTAERAAFYLDAALAARSSGRAGCSEDARCSSHVLFTLHVYQYRMEKCSRGGMSGGRSRLHLFDLGSCEGAPGRGGEAPGGPLCLSLSALGSIVLALVSGAKHVPHREHRLTTLLRESLAAASCRATMIAHVSDAPARHAETLSTVQLAARIHRLRRKKVKYASSSSGGDSSCEEGRAHRPPHLRHFHPRSVAPDPDRRAPSSPGDPDYSSSSEQSCDTVIYIGPNGTALSDKELTDNEGPPDFVPIVPALQKARGDSRSAEAGEAAAGKSERDCLKCNTFAELQERLDCIDGSEEPSKFPFEELPAQLGAEQASKSLPLSQAAGAGPLCESDQEDDGSDGQLTHREGAEPPASRVQRKPSPVPAAQLSHSPTPASPRSIPGSSSSSSSQHGSSQLVQSSSLQSSRESLNSCGFVEGKPRPMGSPRLGIASLSKTSEYKPASSPSQRCKVYTQKGVLPSPAPLPTLSKDSGMVSSESLLQPELRTPPVGMSPQVLKKSMSAGSEGFPEIPVDDDQQAATSPDSKEILSTTMVTVQQPLELNGEDELVFTLVEELTISGVLDSGRPTSIISFNSDCSVQALASGSRPVSIIGSVSEDLECYSNVAPVSEVSITQFLPLPKLSLEEKAREAGSRRSSISSWLSEMSTGSDGEPPCHGFIAQTCFGHGEAMADPPASEFVQNTAVVCQEKPKAGPDNLLILSEMGEDAFNKAPPIKGCKISTLGKAMVTISNTASLSGCEGYIPMKTNITVYPCIAMSPRNVQEPEVSAATAGSVPKAAQSQENKESGAKKEMKFEDPWLKREEEVKKENAYPSEEGIRYETVPGRPKPEARAEQDRKASPGDRLSSSSGEVSASPVADNFRRVVDGCEMALPTVAAQSPGHLNKILKSSSLPRAFQKGSRQDELDSLFYHCAAETNGIGSASGTQPSKATLERKVASPKHCVLARPKGTPPLPPVRKSSLDQKNRASPQHSAGSSSSSSPLNQPAPFLAVLPDEPSSGKMKDASSSKLFSAKLEQLASRTNSLGRTTVSHYECLSLERAESLSSMSSRLHAGKDSTMPRTGRSPGRSAGASPTNPGPTQSAGASPKASQSKISAVSKLLLASPKARSLSTTTTKTLSFSTKSLPQAVGQSSGPAPGGKHMSWSTQSLSRSRGSGLASKLPLRAVNGRISELLQGGAGPRGLAGRAGPETEERAVPADERPPPAAPLPSPYSKVTPPRRPHRCSSGHGSDNSSVLSGELPPAMGRTALFYHSGGSSGYESMMRDSEATGSASSAQDSMSENSSSVGGRCRSLKAPKKRTNSGSQRRRLIPALSLDTPSPVRKPANSAGVRWVDGPLRSTQRGLGEPFEIKVYEIDDVERLQRRRGGKEIMCFNAKLKILEHRQQRIAEVRAKYEWLMKELETTKQYLMLDPNKWLSEFDLEQVLELDSLEYLEALECVTERLESRVNFCKAHLMMITCFDVTSRRR
uniref:Kinesin-like protein KIF26B n=1 Tax=Sus scrofa TaxID=9823 RepID=A0A481C1X9_PIG